jgi:hypothetical protein
MKLFEVFLIHSMYYSFCAATYSIREYSTPMASLGDGKTSDLSPHFIKCSDRGGLLNSFSLSRPTDSTLQFDYTCIDEAMPEAARSQKTTLLNDFGFGNIIYLDRHNVNCEGKLLTDLHLVYQPNGPSIQFAYSCVDYGPVQCYTKTTTQQNADAETSSNVIYLDRFKDLSCGESYALSQFLYSYYFVDRYSWQGDYYVGKFTYTCCRMDTTPTPTKRPTRTPSLRPTIPPTIPPPTRTPTFHPSVMPSISFAPTSPSGMPSSEPTIDAQVWQCSNGKGRLDKTCSELLDGEQRCLPGLTTLFGRGLDITQLPDFSRAVRGRVYDFDDTPVTTSIGSRLFRAPDHSKVTVDAMEKTTKSVEYESSYFESLHSYQSKMAISIDLEGGLSSSPTSSTSKSSMMAAFLSGIGIGSDTANSIDSDAKGGSYHFANKAAIEKARYSLIPSAHGETCSSNIFKKLKSLPQQYETNTMKAYDQFISEFGTHILTDLTLGGTISLENSMEYCSVTQKQSVEDSYSLYHSQLANFLTASSDSSTTYFETVIYRSSSNICGGDSSLYSSTHSNPWYEWSRSLFDNEHAVCPVSYTLLPIWAIAGTNIQLKENLEQAVVKYIATVVENADVSNAVLDPSTECVVSAAHVMNPLDVRYSIVLGLLIAMVPIFPL